MICCQLTCNGIMKCKVVCHSVIVTTILLSVRLPFSADDDDENNIRVRPIRVSAISNIGAKLTIKELVASVCRYHCQIKISVKKTAFAICHRPSVCRLSFCNVRAPYSGN